MSLAVKSWRTAFLTLRDETLASLSCPALLHLLNNLIFSQSDFLIAAAPDLPPHEVTSDLMLLMELAQNICNFDEIEDVALSFTKLSHLIHGVSHRALIQLKSLSLVLVLDSFKRIVQTLLGKAKTRSASAENDAVIKPTKEILESIRNLFGRCQAAAFLSENEQLLSFLLQVVGCFQGDSMYSSYLSDNHIVSGYNGVWEVLTIAFVMIGEVYSRVGSSLSVDLWHSTIEVLRKFVDVLTSKGLLAEDDYIAKFYFELLHCLHLVLVEPRGSLEGHVSGFVAALRKFFRYGIIIRSCGVTQTISHNKVVGSTSKNLHFSVSSKSKTGTYRPPHLREKVVEDRQHKDEESVVSPDESSSGLITSSDSDCSDNDGPVTSKRSGHFAKARLAAIVCVQDLCRADPKLFTAQWTLLLPSSDVLQQRQYEATLMSCLLFDPYLKVRIAAGSSIMAMLDGPASVSLQVAEFRGPSKCGSFTALSSSLGHILMQLHTGTLYLIKHETHSRMLAVSFKILTLLTSSTPYSRMPEELLSMVISSLKSRIDEDFPLQCDHSGLLAAAVNCLTIALSVSPSSLHVNNMLLVEISKGSIEGQLKPGVLFTLLRHSEQLSTPSISLEAFQALKALAHNYPNVVALCWDQISSIIQGVISFSSEVPVRSRWGNSEHSIASIKERVMTAAIKVLDECLRAISGFKGTEDLSNKEFLDSPFTSDYVKTKAISSAPSYTLEGPASTKDESESCMLASQRWFEATEKHIPKIIKNSSPMVRAASITCFAGMTSSVFLLLPKDKQEFIINSSIDAALVDEVPSVKSAACRAIGVIARFPEIHRSTEVLEKFIHAAEHNTHDKLVSVRITASWALANICDSLDHCMSTQHGGRCSIESRKSSQIIRMLVDSSLRLARDNDKVKANAVRALGNLSRYVQFTSQSSLSTDAMGCMCFKLEKNDAVKSNDDMRVRSDSLPSSSLGNFEWLENMVQAFLSCVATGNVKVQWNVCHALSNLFFNKTLKLQDMDWASSVFSILLLLLRDSSNFKIKIQAAAALAVPQTINDYGRSYYDVVKGVEQIVESFKSDQISAPSNFKYWIALEKQLTSTMLHLLCLAGRCDYKALQDLLIKKSSFLEVWIKNLCASLGDSSDSVNEVNRSTILDQKKNVLCRTIDSLIKVYENSNNRPMAQRFNRLANILE